MAEIALFESSASQWRSAFARFHFHTLQAKLDGERIWSVEPEYDQRDNTLGAEGFQDQIDSTMNVSERPAGE